MQNKINHPPIGFPMPISLKVKQEETVSPAELEQMVQILFMPFIGVILAGIILTVEMIYYATNWKNVKLSLIFLKERLNIKSYKRRLKCFMFELYQRLQSKKKGKIMFSVIVMYLLYHLISIFFVHNDFLPSKIA